MELKRTMRTGELTIEEMGDRLGYIETKTIRPEPIPWTGKIVAHRPGERLPRCSTRATRTSASCSRSRPTSTCTSTGRRSNERAYAGLIAAVTKKEGLLPLDRGAVARVVEEGMRMAEDHNKLSIRFGDLTDIVREAVALGAQERRRPSSAPSTCARRCTSASDRVNLIEEHLREAIYKDIIVVDTEGEAVGQVNGLSVVDLGDTAFGQPSRITATVGVGREGIVDLQREARLSGPIHSKAVLTLQGFLVDRYADETRR